MKNRYLFYTTFIVCIFNLITAYSDTIKVTSEKLNIYRDKSTSVFSGNVYAEDSNIKLWSDNLSIFFDENKNNVYEIISENNVKIIVDDVTAYGNFSRYKIDSNEILLKGDVVVIEKNNKIQSDQLLLDLTNSTSIMTAKTNKRVTAQINKLNDK